MADGDDEPMPEKPGRKRKAKAEAKANSDEPMPEKPDRKRKAKAEAKAESEVKKARLDTSKVKPIPKPNAKLKPEDQELNDRLSKYMAEETTPFSVVPMGRVVESSFTRSPSHPYTDEKARQGAKHLSATLLEIAKLGDERPIAEDEIQIMSIGKLHVLTANNKASTQLLANRLKELTKGELIAFFQEHLGTILKPVKRMALKTFTQNVRKRGTYDKIRFCVKLISALSGRRMGKAAGIVGDLLASQGKDSFAELVHHAKTPAEAAKHLKGNTSVLKLVFLDPEPGVHAEQNFISALVELRDGRAHLGDIQIYGSKRPCYMCFSCLSFAREKLGVQLKFNEHPGQFWGPACESFSIVGRRIWAEQARRASSSEVVKASLEESDLTSKSANDAIEEWFESFQKKNLKMFFSVRWRPLPRTEGWGEPKLERGNKNQNGEETVKLSGIPGGNYQSDSESDCSDTELKTIHEKRSTMLGKERSASRPLPSPLTSRKQQKQQ
ncbi:hypothetical protein [Sorangium sp. So ce1099]|uniref:hypothetical protein n=1 Tax=Sorangium sp. So ce1099 TaxID=3133331 RepID=UPI003F5ECE1C